MLQFSPLTLVKHRIHLGQPLPFNVRDNDHTLLLARGQVLNNDDQLAALFARGALVDLAELTTVEMLSLVSPQELPRLWQRCMNQLGETLRHSDSASFREALDSAAPPVLALIERDKDLAIFQVLRQSDNPLMQYGIHHSVHTAITSYMVAQRLGWSEDETQCAFKAALTMNISMLELQGQLAQQNTPPTPEQRAQIQAHPLESRRILELAGIQHEGWLSAVAQHHEAHDGSGYPLGLRDPCDTAALLRRADVYTAKLSARAGRSALAADKAGRMMFMQDAGHPMTAALVKEFGVYPPGCWVKLANGEVGIVVRRGPTVMAPVVAVMCSPSGNTLAEPVRRDTSHPPHAVHSVLGSEPRRLRVIPEQLMALAHA